MTDAFHTQRYIQGLLARADRHPRHRFGQHFLIDRNLMMKLVDAAALEAGDVVVEVGTGTGSLTRLLAERVKVVHTFEIDAAMADIAQQELTAAGNVVLHRGDALQSKTSLSPILVGILAAAAHAPKLVANLPYDIATPLLVELLLADRPPQRMCFTIQREVGERLTAAHDTREYGPAGLVCRLFAAVERLAQVPPTAFWPKPKIDSVLMRMTPRSDLPDAHSRRHIADVVRRAFLHRRKTMRHIMADLQPPDAADELLETAGIAASARPESLPPQSWERLASLLPPREPRRA